MGTIFTIHGTNATGPEEGEKWWQRGSDFERDVRDYVEAEEGKLDFRPFIWDGKNSETSRRAAGIRLADDIQRLDKNNVNFVAIGHSHGGSIIANGLLWLSKKKRKPISCLSRYITVGTPFIHGRRKRLLYARLGLAGKTAYVILLYLFCTQILTIFPIRELDDGKWVFGHTRMSVLTAFSSPLLYLLVILSFYLFAHFAERKRLFFTKDGRQVKSERFYSSLWLGMNHKNDEAIHGLNALEEPKLLIFGKSFAVDWLSVAAVPIFIPVLFFGSTLIFSDRVMEFLSFIYGPLFKFIRRFLPELPVEGPLDTLNSIMADIEIITIVITIALLFVGLSRVCAIFLSWFSSGALNRLTWGQIRQNAYGNDTRREVAVGTMRKPFWVKAEFDFLPDELGNALTQVADEAAAKSISRIRAAIGELAFSSMDKSKTDSFSHYMTWDELIHTIYFKVPTFRKFVCYAIAHSPGFRPSEKLTNDSDYQKLGRWLEEINPKLVVKT